MKKLRILQVAVFVAALGAFPAAAFAASNSTFNQQITNGSLSTDIMDASRASVASPAVAMDAQGFSFDCRTSSKGFGSNSERIYVSDGDTTNANGWTLSLAATGGATASWSDGSGNNFDFNDASGSGCTDGADADSLAGQMTVNPAAGTLTADCTGCNTTGVSLGSGAAFNQGTVDNITLMSAGASASNIWRGYLTGATISQAIPGGQKPGTYSMNLTLTVTAN